MSDPADRVLETWRASAPHWERHGPVIRRMFAPITRAMLEAARIEAGERVLDVAGGVGEPSCEIATIVGPRGMVVCTDIVERMVGAARRAASALALADIRFACCAAGVLPFVDRAFDHVVSRLGAMFFPDPRAALRELLRVTRPGGRMTLAVWSGPESNPMFSTVTAALSRHLPMPPEPPDAPGAFRFAVPGALLAIAREAGARNATEQPLRFEIEGPFGFEEFWRMRTQTSDTLRDKLGQLSRLEERALTDEVREATRDYFRDGRMRFPAAAILVRGESP